MSCLPHSNPGVLDGDEGKRGRGAGYTFLAVGYPPIRPTKPSRIFPQPPSQNPISLRFLSKFVCAAEFLSQYNFRLVSPDEASVSPTIA